MTGISGNKGQSMRQGDRGDLQIGKIDRCSLPPQMNSQFTGLVSGRNIEFHNLNIP